MGGRLVRRGGRRHAVLPRRRILRGPRRRPLAQTDHGRHRPASGDGKPCRGGRKHFGHPGRGRGGGRHRARPSGRPRAARRRGERGRDPSGYLGCHRRAGPGPRDRRRQGDFRLRQHRRRREDPRHACACGEHGAAHPGQRGKCCGAQAEDRPLYHPLLPCLHPGGRRDRAADRYRAQPVHRRVA